MVLSNLNLLRTVLKGQLNLHLFYSPLFEPEAFHTGNYKKITQQCGSAFYFRSSPPVSFNFLFKLICEIIIMNGIASSGIK